MTWLEILSASSRRIILAVGVTALLCAGSNLNARAQGDDQLKFDYDGPMLLLYQIKPDRTADFEALWAGIRAGLAKSTKPEVKAFGETLVPWKVQGVDGLYMFRLDPPSKTMTYNPVKLLYDNVNATTPADGLFTRAEADDLYKKFDGSFQPNGIQPWKLAKVGG
jgi:hypothetical protein